MMGYQSPYFNPYGFMQQAQTQQILPVQQVVKVNGENGARAFTMGANSSALLLDESGTLVWLVTSDGAGYKTVSAYDIVPHQEQPKPDYSTLEQRIEKLEMIVNGTSRNPSAVGKKRAGKLTDGCRHKPLHQPTDGDDSCGRRQRVRPRRPAVTASPARPEKTRNIFRFPVEVPPFRLYLI